MPNDAGHAKKIKGWLRATTAPDHIQVNGVRFIEQDIPLPDGNSIDLLAQTNGFVTGTINQCVVTVVDGSATEADALKLLSAMGYINRLQMEVLPSENEPFDYEAMPGVNGLLIAQVITEPIRVLLANMDVMLWAYTPRRSGDYVLTVVNPYRVRHEDFSAYCHESAAGDLFWQLYQHNKNVLD